MSSGEVARLRGANGVTRRRGLRCAYGFSRRSSQIFGVWTGGGSEV